MMFWDGDKYDGSNIIETTRNKSVEYFNRYKRIASNVFEWENLPEGIESNDIELLLSEYRNVMLYSSMEMGPVCTKSEIIGYSITNRPRALRPIFINANSPFSDWERPTLIDGEDCVFISDLINDKKSRMDYINDARICEMMADIDVAIGQQLINQRAPLFFDSEGVLGRKKGEIFTREIVNGCNVFFGDGGIDKKLTALKIDSAYNVESLINVKKAFFNEGLEMLGVNNEPAMQKRERMNDSEVESNDELLNVYLRDAMTSRLNACKKIKKVFGVDTTVKLIDNMRISEQNDEDEGADDDGIL
jgi:hypothetical protein